MSHGEKHHYIPEFYLKQWTGVDRRLCEYSRPFDRIKTYRRYPSETGYEYGLTTLTTYPDPVSEIVERKLMQAIDSSAANALRFLLANNVASLDAKGRSAWARFIFSLMRRTPEAVRDIHQRLRESFLEIYRLNPPPHDVSEEAREADLLGRVEQRKALLLQDLVNSDLNGPRLINMRWTVAHFTNTRHKLLTSDRPFIMTNGIAYPDSHIVVPISPTQCFYAAANAEVELKLRSLSAAEFIFRVNGKMASQARKFVYGVDDTELAFVTERFGQKLKAGPGDV
jgi:Protein of unknown function (DUF4238)